MMTKKVKMPCMVVDEVILLVDAYFQYENTTNKKEKDLIIQELSSTMRSLPFFPNLIEDPRFRSIAGMQMCLANVGYVDPNNSSKFGHGSTLQRKIFNKYINRKEDLHRLAKAIAAISKKNIPIDYSFSENETGMLVPSFHQYIEKHNKVVVSVANELKRNGRTSCAVCGKDLSDIYVNGENLIEVHFSAPIYLNVPRYAPSPSELIGLCPTCHKLAHSSFDLYEYENLKQMIK